MGGPLPSGNGRGVTPKTAITDGNYCYDFGRAADHVTRKRKLRVVTIATTSSRLSTNSSNPIIQVNLANLYYVIIIPKVNIDL